MRVGDSWRKLASSDLGVLVLLAIAEVLLHAVTNGQYSFHRDELATLDDARSLAWGYVAYPPLTPFLARIAFIVFGPSLIGLRFFAAVALGLVLVLTGLMARYLEGEGRHRSWPHWPRRSTSFGSYNVIGDLCLAESLRDIRGCPNASRPRLSLGPCLGKTHSSASDHLQEFEKPRTRFSSTVEPSELVFMSLCNSQIVLLTVALIDGFLLIIIPG